MSVTLLDAINPDMHWNFDRSLGSFWAGRARTSPHGKPDWWIFARPSSVPLEPTLQSLYLLSVLISMSNHSRCRLCACTGFLPMVVRTAFNSVECRSVEDAHRDIPSLGEMSAPVAIPKGTIASLSSLQSPPASVGPIAFLQRCVSPLRDVI